MLRGFVLGAGLCCVLAVLFGVGYSALGDPGLAGGLVPAAGGESSFNLGMTRTSNRAKTVGYRFPWLSGPRHPAEVGIANYGIRREMEEMPLLGLEPRTR